MTTLITGATGGLGRELALLFANDDHDLLLTARHADQLAELQSHAPERIVEAVWGESYSAGYSLVVRVTANDRSGLLRDITTILANEKVNVLGVASRSDTREQLATIDMTIEIYNLQVLGRVLGKLNQVPDVIDARRLHGG